MSCLGFHYALTEEQSDALWDAYLAQDDDAVLEAVLAIEEAWDQAHLQQSDKAWDAIHRVLSDGTLTPDAGKWPLSGAVLGGECLYFRDDWLVRFIDEDEVPEIATALECVTRDWFRERFATLPAHGYYGTADDEDFDYTWTWFEQLRAFFRRTAGEGRAILFTADQ